MRWRS